MPGGSRKCDRTDRLGECIENASGAFRAARALPPPGAKGPATAKAERSADPSDPRGSVRRRAISARPEGAVPGHEGQNARPWPQGRQRKPTPSLPRRQEPARMQETSVAERMRKHRPGNGPGASRPGRRASGHEGRSDEGTRLRAAAVEAGSDAGLHLYLPFAFEASMACERDAWIAHPQPLPLAGGERDLRRHWRR